jgi:hypothetical protein
MHRLSNGTQVTTLPEPASVTGTPGYATGGILGGLAPSDIDPDAFNAHQEELASIVLAAGGTLDKTNNGQVLPSLNILFGSGRLLNVQTITASGTYTPTAGMNTATAYCQGAGAGSGGLPACTADQYAISGGACSGALAIGRFTAAQIGASQPVIIGAAGAAGASGGGTGGGGGSTSFGALLTAPGGIGTPSAGPTSSALLVMNGSSTLVSPTGGTIANVLSNPGAYSLGGAAISGAAGITAVGGIGGVSPLFGGRAYGSGGPGAAIAGGSAVPGNAGYPAILIIYEYS